MTRDSLKNKQSWRPGDIKILHHPNPDVLERAKKIQEEAKQERIENENKSN